MANLNLNEYGQTLRINMGENVSTATAFKFILEPRQGTKKEKVDADGVVLGTTNITVDDEDWLANEYIEYTLKDGDLDYAGQWRIKGEATMSATNKVISDYKLIGVLE